MRKSALILTICFIMVINSGVAAEQADELTDLAAVVMDNDLSVDSWQVTIKEEMDADTISRMLDKIQAETGYKVTGTEDENAVKYFIEDTQKKSGITETYNVVIPKNPLQDAQLIAVLEGEDWDSAIADVYFTRLETIQSTYFTNKSTKFACLTTNVDDKIDNAYFFSQLKESLHLKHIDMQTDNVKNSTVKKIVYGYTPLWEQEITMKKPMNLQMVVQNSTHDGKRITIGTPILITEY
ncbi:YwmB family TATA-box binding protein [Lentibacillus salinarum]|uniref:YwmB family TATA-box binding protein n=1 Tax=Lentibacillus salinarum TaxID=446820 RepID=A0ABW3ZW32_9BACI